MYNKHSEDLMLHALISNMRAGKGCKMAIRYSDWCDSTTECAVLQNSNIFF